MRWIHFVVNISQKSMSSANVWKCQDSVLGHEYCRAANSKSTGPQQQSVDDRNCSVDSVAWLTSADWQTTDVDDQWRLLLACNCPSSTAEQFHEGIEARAEFNASYTTWQLTSEKQHIEEVLQVLPSHKACRAALISILLALSQTSSHCEMTDTGLVHCPVACSYPSFWWHSLLPTHRRMTRRQSWPAWLVIYRDNLPPAGWLTVTHPTSNRDCCRLTSLMWPSEMATLTVAVTKKNRWLGGVTAESQTHDRDVMVWLLLGRMSDCRQVNHICT